MPPCQALVPGRIIYHPDPWVFCGGTPHDETHVEEDDETLRKALKDRGDTSVYQFYPFQVKRCYRDDGDNEFEDGVEQGLSG